MDMGIKARTARLISLTVVLFRTVMVSKGDSLRFSLILRDWRVPVKNGGSGVSPVAKVPDLPFFKNVTGLNLLLTSTPSASGTASDGLRRNTRKSVSTKSSLLWEISWLFTHRTHTEHLPFRPTVNAARRIGFYRIT